MGRRMGLKTKEAKRKGEKTTTVSFDVRQSNVLKGFFIICMLLHHLFYDAATFAGYEVDFAPFGEHKVIVLVQSFKYVMAGFTFLTYYGMTAKLKGKTHEEKWQLMPGLIGKRVLTLLFSFLPVYVLSLILALVMKQDLFLVYSREEQSFFGYAVLDALGLADFFQTPTLNITWWYMSFAYIILFLFPFFYALYERFGWLFLGGALVLPVAMGWDGKYLGICAFTLALGIYTKEHDTLEKWRMAGSGRAEITLLKLIIGVAGFALLCKLPFVVPVSNFNFAAGTLWACFFFFTFVGQIPGISHLLALLGKYSMNIFLIHTFLYYYYFGTFIYSFRYWLLIAAVLLGISLAVSIAIEGLKKLCHYERLVKRVAAQLFR